VLYAIYRINLPEIKQIQRLSQWKSDREKPKIFLINCDEVFLSCTNVKYNEREGILELNTI